MATTDEASPGRCSVCQAFTVYPCPWHREAAVRPVPVRPVPERLHGYRVCLNAVRPCAQADAFAALCTGEWRGFLGANLYWGASPLRLVWDNIALLHHLGLYEVCLLDAYIDVTLNTANWTPQAAAPAV